MKKMENNLFLILQNDLKDSLSPSEYEYCVNYYKMLNSHFSTEFLSKVPQKFGVD